MTVGAAQAEAALVRRWQSGVRPAWLRTSEGETLRVLFRGVRNGGAGPDFRGALFLGANGRPLRGDVEVHRRVGDWWRHGHHTDGAYREVVLHVVGAIESRPGGGGPPRTLLLPPAAAGAGESHVFEPPCHGLVQRAGAQAVGGVLARLGRDRLQRKALRLRRALADGGDPDQLAYRLLLEALGQGGDPEVMRRTAGALPLAALPAEAPAACKALLAAHAAVAGGGARAPGPRPANRPVWRLAAAAALIHRFRSEEEGLAAGLAALAMIPAAAAQEALRLPRLLGAERARQLLVDVVYPLAWARSAALGPQLSARWLALPGARYGRTQPLRRRLERGGLGPWRNGATQALLHLERSYCRNGACAVCPLAALGRSGPAAAARSRAGDQARRSAPAENGSAPEVENTSKASAASAAARSSS